ncbi:MAG: hypothetical protein ACM3VU_00510 [Arthrospira platensis]
MKNILTYLLVGVPGLCFLIGGALNGEYAGAALGGILVIESLYGLSRKRAVMVGNGNQMRQRRSFVLAGIIGASFAITGIASHRYLLATAGTVLLIGSLVQLHRMTFDNGH